VYLDANAVLVNHILCEIAAKKQKLNKNDY